jgi:Ser/Thr protein kinase RdoA (MazF antagonist)
LGEGRMAEVFALDGQRVVKLDRPEWSGVSEFEERVLRVVYDAGLPVPCPHGTVTIDGRSGLPPVVTSKLVCLLDAFDNDERQVCHFDLHPGNVLVTPEGWTVIDWLGAASGPSAADFARTLILRGDTTRPSMARFVRAVRRHGCRLRGIDNRACRAWARVVAAARLAEGLGADHAAWLRDVAMGPSGHPGPLTRR